MSDMITIAKDTLPQTFLSYIAFRTAMLDTMERVSWTLQFDSLEETGFGFLTEVPFLRAVPPHVQMDLLATTWWKHISPDVYEADLVDEAIVYAACETAARSCEDESAVVSRLLARGPVDVKVNVDASLANELRSLHLKLSNDGDFLLIGQFSDLPPEEADRLKKKFNFDTARAEAMFDVLSRWNISPNFETRCDALLTAKEAKRTYDLMCRKVESARQKS
ncbi:MAG TPA: hypothetical protein DD473_19820 [Planctomycetaceae bacterium]|nr:hypothetical protein [Planctomycetaceae bacterium]